MFKDNPSDLFPDVNLLRYLQLRVGCYEVFFELLRIDDLFNLHVLVVVMEFQQLFKPIAVHLFLHIMVPLEQVNVSAEEFDVLSAVDFHDFAGGAVAVHRVVRREGQYPCHPVVLNVYNVIIIVVGKSLGLRLTLLDVCLYLDVVLSAEECLFVEDLSYSKNRKRHVKSIALHFDFLLDVAKAFLDNTDIFRVILLLHYELFILIVDLSH